MRLWCPAMSNYSNHWSSTKSCHSQMGMQAAVLVFQWETPVTTHRLMMTPKTWRSHFLTRSCVLPGMISEAWPSVYVSSGVQPHQRRLYYIQFCVRADFTAICLFGHVVSQRETWPEASITRERGNRADQSVLSIRQPGLSRLADCVLRIREVQLMLGDFCCAAAAARCLFKELEDELQPQ